MVSKAIKQAESIERKQFVPEHKRTDDKDKAADYIADQFVNGDRDWSKTTISELAEETKYTRQHIANTLEGYFKPAERADIDDPDLIESLTTNLDIERSGDDYIEGYRDGFVDAAEALMQDGEISKSHEERL